MRFANPSPPSGWVKDFHLQAVDHARHTKRKTASAREAVSITQRYLLALALLDDDLPVWIAIAITLDHDGLVPIAILTLADHFTVAIAVVTAATDGDANARGTNANAYVLCSHRLYERNSSYRDGSYCKMLNHRMFLSKNLSGEQFAEM
ncbi:MAG: hypothetical protein H0V72_17440 [Bradyrhizobium sp.]|nr:hypothetical protein [Bradyrhizobium sp.]